MKPGRRKRTRVVPGGGHCSLCGKTLMLVTSQRVRAGLAWLDPFWNAEVEVHLVCSVCGARQEVH